MSFVVIEEVSSVLMIFGIAAPDVTSTMILWMILQPAETSKFKFVRIDRVCEEVLPGARKSLGRRVSRYSRNDRGLWYAHLGNGGTDEADCEALSLQAYVLWGARRGHAWRPPLIFLLWPFFSVELRIPQEKRRKSSMFRVSLIYYLPWFWTHTAFEKGLHRSGPSGGRNSTDRPHQLLRCDRGGRNDQGGYPCGVSLCKRWKRRKWER